MRPCPRADDGNLASDQGSGATPAGWRQQNQEVPTAIGGVGSGKRGAVVGTSGGDDSSSKDDASKGGGAVVEPRSKIPQQPGSQANQAVKPARPARKSGPVGTLRKSGPAGPAGRSAMPRQPGNLGLPGSQACREIWACRANRAKNHAAPAGSGGRKETTPGRKENALAEKRKYP